MPISTSLLNAESLGKFVRTSGTVGTLGPYTITTSVSGIGGIDTGAIANSTFYYVYLVRSGSTTGLVFSTSAVSPTGFTTYRKVGAFYTSTVGAIFKTYYLNEVNTLTYSCSVGFSGVVSDESADFINGNFVITGTSIYTAPFVAGIFSLNPQAVATPNGNTGGVIIYSWQIDTDVTPGSVVFKNFTGGTQATVEWYLVVSKAGVDAVQPDWNR